MMLQTQQIGEQHSTARTLEFLLSYSPKQNFTSDQDGLLLI